MSLSLRLQFVICSLDLVCLESTCVLDKQTPDTINPSFLNPGHCCNGKRASNVTQIIALQSDQKKHMASFFSLNAGNCLIQVSLDLSASFHSVYSANIIMKHWVSWSVLTGNRIVIVISK